MSEKNICEMVCTNLLDEREAQQVYTKLANELRNDSYPEEAEAVEKLIITDEKKHEEYLKVLNQSHNCRCPGVVHTFK